MSLAVSSARGQRPIFAPSGAPQLHLAGTSGALDVDTDEYLDTRTAIRDACAVNGIVAVIGDWGLGKTNACYRAALELDIIPAYLELAPERLGKELEQHMIERVSEGYDTRRTRSQMRADLRTIGASNRFVFILDEVERSAGYGIELIRYLWTQVDNQVTFVLIGSKLDPFLDANPALKGRITRFRRFAEWTPAQTIEIIPRYHPLFGPASPGLLRHIYDRYTGGRFRSWARMLEACLAEMAVTGETTLTRDLADRAWTRVIG